jgi:rSAM/selenodomain-associated transferase 2
MNAGAEAATGQTLFFLHADCRPDPLSLWRIGQVFADPDAVGGGFELKLDSANPLLKIVEITANWRSHLLGKPYGDQGIFVRKDVFRDVGGFPNWPLMEDIELARRLREAGQLKIIPAPMLASARKWESGGVLRTYLTMKLTQWGYYLGVSPDSLYRFYERGTRR